MENVEKLRVLLQHWIDHNKGHVEEFENWRKIMADEGQQSLSAHITQAIKTMAEVNAELAKALHEVGGPKSGEDSGHHHHHDH
jgi:molecular chaperone GrpE (heat shock protein)